MAKKKKKVNTKKKNNTKEIVFTSNEPIFKFINPNGNDKLSNMSGYDLQDLLILIDEYYIQLRKQLGFEQYITFGLELEFENAMRNKIERKLGEAFGIANDWIVKGDDSLNKGVEINSPILRDNETTWNNLDKVCSLAEPFATVGKNSGGHIHIGTQVLGYNKEAWLNFIKMWSVYENIIYRFVYGDFLTARPSRVHAKIKVATFTN